MSEVERLLRQYIEDDAAGADPDPLAFLERVNDVDRTQLEVMIDAYLQRRPRRPFDAAAYRRSDLPELVEGLSRSLRGVSGLWPSLLPSLRNRARIRRADLVAQLAERLGAQSRQDKVADYYNQMEHGLLPAAGVSDSVLEALGKIVGQSRQALRRAGEAVGPSETSSPPGAAPAFARAAEAEPKYAGEPAAAAGPDVPGRWDEVDRLFRGG